MSKRNGLKMWIIGALFSMVLAGATITIRSMTSDIIRVEKEVDSIRMLQTADYQELQMGQQAIRSDLRSEGERSRMMDSLMFAELQAIKERLR